MSVNGLARPLVEALLRDRETLRLGVSKLANGCRVVDAGIEHSGGMEAGRRIAEICLGGLGRVDVQRTQKGPWPFGLMVQSSQPVLACLASQYAGWDLSEGGFHALGSGPARAIGSRERLFKDLSYRDRATGLTCMVIESEKLPPEALADKIARRCGIDPSDLVLVITPTTSTAGMVQIAARVLEAALHKAHQLKFPPDRIIDGVASVPLPPPSPRLLHAMGRSNDTIILAGQVWLLVDDEEADAEQLAEQLPSNTSKDYGRPFAELFEAVEGNFYRLDPMLFSPAEVTVTTLRTGRSFHEGRAEPELLRTADRLTELNT